MTTESPHPPPHRPPPGATAALALLLRTPTLAAATRARLTELLGAHAGRVLPVAEALAVHPSGVRALALALGVDLPAVARGARRPTSAAVAPGLGLSRQRVDQLVERWAALGVGDTEALARLARGERPPKGKPGRRPRGGQENRPPG